MLTLKPHLRNQLEATVSRLRSNFKWYDERVATSGYDEAHDLALLPFIDESILNKHYYASADQELEGCTVYYTSGTSSGSRKRILYSHEDHAQYLKQREQIFTEFVSPDCRVACADLGTGHAAASASTIFKRMGLEAVEIDFRQPVEEHIRLLNLYRPDLLFTMPMILDSIIHAGSLKFSPKQIIVVGDVASVTWKNRIVEHFQLPRPALLDIVGSIEIGAIAYECFDCGFYHLHDHIIGEAFKPTQLYEDHDYPGEAKILILTSLSRTAFPAVRFVTNDLVEGFGEHECCGVPRWGFSRMIGRVGTEFKHGEKICLYDISEAVNTFIPGARFEVHRQVNRLSIRVCSTQMNDEVAEKIKRFVRQRNPAVDQMITSSLVPDLDVCRVTVEELSANVSKQSFALRK